MNYTREQVETAVKSKGYVWFEDPNNKGYDVNIIGIRNSSTGQKVTNVFDDYITLSYKVDGEKKFHIWPATTDPGTKGVMQFGNKAGVARLVEGQYRGSHTMRLHAGKYEALGQNKPVKVFRDPNKHFKQKTLLQQFNNAGVSYCSVQIKQQPPSIAPIFSLTVSKRVLHLAIFSLILSTLFLSTGTNAFTNLSSSLRL